MTRSSQQPPASPGARTESSSGGEQSTATAAPGSTSGPATLAEPAAAKTGAVAGKAGRTGTEAPEAEKESGAAAKNPDEGAKAPGEGRTTGPETAASSGARSESEADSDATAAAQSRLPGLVRTMTATAIGRPQQEDGPVGRPGRAVLAGAAVAGALLVSVPFLILAGNDDKGPEQPSVAAAGTVLDGSTQEAPGEFAVTTPESGSPDEGKKKAPVDPVPEKPVKHVPAPDPSEDKPKKDADPEDKPEKQSEKKESGGAQDKPAKASSGVTFSAPVSFRSHLSGRCIDVPDHDFSDGKALHVWDCNNAAAQKWRFASDGTVRIADKCLDVANANFSDGTPMQITWCNGNAAQQFALNGSHDLVNTVVGMCVDIAGADRNNGAALQLLTCTGNPAQKWST
ncbi:ricin-type beta-trefoil lectin domain protein [Streptomyces sp. NPDC005794]|uniref:ricin-type beta-trefoil lectin domain protein n=1 Tax=Streptomyces sp. NPDC005794 TaxID=3364733 RepID=UPI003678998F